MVTYRVAVTWGATWDAEPIGSYRQTIEAPSAAAALVTALGRLPEGLDPRSLFVRVSRFTPPATSHPP